MDYCFPTIRAYVDSHGIKNANLLEEILDKLGLPAWPLNRNKAWDATLDSQGENLSSREKLFLEVAMAYLSSKSIVLVSSDWELLDDESQKKIWDVLSMCSNKTVVFAARNPKKWMRCEQYLWLRDRTIEVFSSTEQFLETQEGYRP